METYSRRVARRGGGFGGRSGIWAGFNAGDGTDDCCLRYHGIALSCWEGGVVDGEASVATSGAASFQPSEGSVAASWDTVSSLTGLELSSRKANPGSSVEGSFLSTRRSALVLKAHRETVEGAVRKDAPLGRGTEVDWRTWVPRQALQMNLEEAALEKDMVWDRADTNGGMALRSSTFLMTSVFRSTDCRPLLASSELPHHMSGLVAPAL